MMMEPIAEEDGGAMDPSERSNMDDVSDDHMNIECQISNKN